MIGHEQTARFLRMESAAPALSAAFHALTGAHATFQRSDALRSISVSDAQGDGSIEATFHGVRIKFGPLLTFGPDRSPRTRVICMQCHQARCAPAQETLGSFSFGADGITDLAPDAQGDFLTMAADAPAIVLHFLEAAIRANQGH